MRAVGGRGSLYHLLFLFLVVINLVAGFQALGTLMAVGLMMLPAAAARLWATTLPVLTVVAAGIAFASGFIGLITSYHLGIASGPAIVLVASLFYVLSILAGQLRDVLIAHALLLRGQRGAAALGAGMRLPAWRAERVLRTAGAIPAKPCGGRSAASLGSIKPCASLGSVTPRATKHRAVAGLTRSVDEIRLTTRSSSARSTPSCAGSQARSAGSGSPSTGTEKPDPTVTRGRSTARAASKAVGA